jgi:hypothetical protein
MSQIIGFLGFLLISLDNNAPDITKKQQIQNLDNKKTIYDNLIYNDKEFTLSWNIKNNSITNIPIEVKNKLKVICKNHTKSALVRINSYVDDKVVGTFDCRL